MYHIFVNLLTKNDILKSFSAGFLFMSLLTQAICYTHFTFTILSHFLLYQNLSTEIKTPFLNWYCYFWVISVWIQALLIRISLQVITSGTLLEETHNLYIKWPLTFLWISNKTVMEVENITKATIFNSFLQLSYKTHTITFLRQCILIFSWDKH